MVFGPLMDDDEEPECCKPKDRPALRTGNPKTPLYMIVTILTCSLIGATYAYAYGGDDFEIMDGAMIGLIISMLVVIPVVLGSEKMYQEPQRTMDDYGTKA